MSKPLLGLWALALTLPVFAQTESAPALDLEIRLASPDALSALVDHVRTALGQEATGVPAMAMLSEVTGLPLEGGLDPSLPLCLVWQTGSDAPVVLGTPLPGADFSAAGTAWNDGVWALGPESRSALPFSAYAPPAESAVEVVIHVGQLRERIAQAWPGLQFMLLAGVNGALAESGASLEEAGVEPQAMLAAFAAALDFLLQPDRVALAVGLAGDDLVTELTVDAAEGTPLHALFSTPLTQPVLGARFIPHGMVAEGVARYNPTSVYDWADALAGELAARLPEEAAAALQAEIGRWRALDAEATGDLAYGLGLAETGPVAVVIWGQGGGEANFARLGEYFSAAGVPVSLSEAFGDASASYRQLLFAEGTPEAAALPAVFLAYTETHGVITVGEAAMGDTLARLASGEATGSPLGAQATPPDGLFALHYLNFGVLAEAAGPLLAQSGAEGAATIQALSTEGRWAEHPVVTTGYVDGGRAGWRLSLPIGVIGQLVRLAQAGQEEMPAEAP